VTVAFEVDTVHQGDVPPAVQVQTVAWEISCGYEFRERSRYLVYVHVDQAGQWTTGLCNGNRALKPWEAPRPDDQSPTGDRPHSDAVPSDQAAVVPGDDRGQAAPADQPRQRPFSFSWPAVSPPPRPVFSPSFSCFAYGQSRSATITSA
jgi:hypothetical protein